MEAFPRITTDLNQMNGQPCVRGLRITVRRVLEALALYPDPADLQREYPELEPEDIRQVLAYAAAHLDNRPVEENLVDEDVNTGAEVDTILAKAAAPRAFSETEAMTFAIEETRKARRR